MDWAFRQLTEQWAVVMNAPAILLSVLILGLLFGWGAAWVILRERLERQRERLDAYKERLAIPAGVSTKAKQPASVIAKRLKRFWEEGTTLLQRVVRTQDDKAQWFRDVTGWKDAVAGYLKSVGLGQEASMFETIQIEPTQKKFPSAFDAEHIGGLKDLDQRISKLRRVLGRAEERAASE